VLRDLSPCLEPLLMPMFHEHRSLSERETTWYWVASLKSSIYRVSVKWGRSQSWEHGRSQEEQKSLISFCSFRNS